MQSFQIGDSPNEEFVVGTVPLPTAMTLLESVAERVGRKLNRLRTSPGSRVLDRVLNGLGAKGVPTPNPLPAATRTRPEGGADPQGLRMARHPGAGSAE